MAEGVLFNVAEGIIRQLGSLAAQEVAIWYGFQDELTKLEDTVTRIKAVLQDAEEQAHAKEETYQIKNWLEKLRRVVYDAEDLLDDFSTEVLRKELMPGSKALKKARVFFSKSNQFLYGWRMGHKVKDLREKLNGIRDDSEQFKFEVRDVDVASFTMFREQTTSAKPEVIIGRGNDKEAIIRFLLDSNYEANVSVISIVGMGGLGKTTLAQHVFNDKQVESHFGLKHWESVSGGLNVKKIVKDILEVVGGDRDSDQLEILKNRLEEKIKDKKKFLFVFDDVWGDMDGEDGEKWYNLKQLLACGLSGSKIVITTRFQKIAAFTSTKGKFHKLEGLSDDDSWDLFKDRAFLQDEEPSRLDIEKIKAEVVKRCCGVPLIIKAIARLMYQIDGGQWLSFVIDQLPSRVQDDNIINTLKLSYDPLPSYMKHCFAYCSLFSKGQKIDVKSLIRLWIAQGFISPSSPNEAFEVAGLRCFEDLLWRSFFCEAERDPLGNIASCKMHDFMHDLAAKVAGSESTKADPEGRSISDSTRHVSFDKELDWSQQIPISLASAKGLRTLMLLRGGKNKSNDGAWESICRYCRRLRVLDLHDLGITQVSPLIKKLKQLKYLDLSRNGMEILPNSVTDLVNLRVLKLNGCRELKALPRDINKLINLRHIDLGSASPDDDGDVDFCGSLEHMPRGIGQLTCLETLSCFVVGAKYSSKSKEIGGLDELKRLNELRGELSIAITGYERSSCISEFKEAKLRDKQCLESLMLLFTFYNDEDYDAASDEDIDLYDEMLQSLEPHSNLQRLMVGGYLGMRFPNWLSRLRNIKAIFLSSLVNCVHIPPLDGIPSLERLVIWSLYNLEYMDTEGVGRRGDSMFFPSLKVLDIQKCRYLKGWWKKSRTDDNEDESSARPRTPAVEEGEDYLMLYYFPRLSYLRIIDCPNLTSMPLFPSLDCELALENTSSVPLQQTMKMTASSAWKSTLPPVSSSSFNQPALSKLKKLEMRDIDDMESLPEDGLQNLSSLQELKIFRCPRLKSLPLSQEMHSLKGLDIHRCPELRSLCPSHSQWRIPHIPSLVWSDISECSDELMEILRGGKQAVEWPNISHIRVIMVEYKDIQRDGKYEL